MRVLKRILGWLPEPAGIRNVYAVIVFMLYSWTLLTSFYNVPSWLFYLTVGQILSIYAYAFLANLVESICLLVGVIFLDIMFFGALKNREGFQVRSILLVLVGFLLISFRLMFFRSDRVDLETFSLAQELTWWLFMLVPGLLLTVFLSKVGWINRFLNASAERALVFLYIYLPLSFLSVIVVTARNLL